MKRSVDDGRTWSKLAILQLDGSQPDLVYDAIREAVVLNFNFRRTGDWPRGGTNMQITSTDRGVSWTSPVALPDGLGLNAAEAGPGLGLQLSSGLHAGRLLFSGWRDQRLGTADGELVWFSDDGGKTFAAAPPFEGGFAEGQLAQTRNGTVVAVLRINEGSLQATKGRGVAVSTDGGATFSPVRFEANLRGVPCQASVKMSRENQRVYFSAPSSLTNRTRGVVRSSADGLDWSDNESSWWHVTEGDIGFGYSSITDLAATSGHLGLLWELQTVGTHLPTSLAFSLVPL